MQTKECDLIIVGAGPAGLNAAINGASEGLGVILIDSGPELGGQAARSSLIENYAGFPDGIAGKDLLGRFTRQAAKFKTDIHCPQTAAALRRDGKHLVITGDDEQVYIAKMVILGLGLSYRRLGVPGLGALMGRGAMYGAPIIDPTSLGKCSVSIVGGANSAGQAAMDLARNPNAHIRMIVRKKLEIQMSQYLLERIKGQKNIEVIEGAEVIEAHGNEKLEGLTLAWQDGKKETVSTDHLFIFIGGAPKTLWLNGSIALDPKRFVLTGPKLTRDDGWALERAPLPFETSMHGVFACGDVRLGSVKRVGSASGEGTAALAMCHEYLRIG